MRDDDQDVFAYGGKNLARPVGQADQVWLLRRMLNPQFAHWRGELAVLFLLVRRVCTGTHRHIRVCVLPAEFVPDDYAAPQVPIPWGSNSHIFVPRFALSNRNVLKDSVYYNSWYQTSSMF
jgi:hypothetical protein